ncbi:bifunctional UDP-N-acetylglucosamine diphosphorylase/glucosamine-1-phosphate N-acetyltransferase GlmU [Bosea sp. (in: a-proteobacteria)]|uniref:bifunctional UDP-N-acetylglucosamine diphosphorylase/glucosamine-1-phosphate N-acetyltransferase GlmU n=1 Tax=Bosea sp. (in: a-proteobacteria) TaxID=1871050 RepID=UPI0012009B71|nr:bifunctional UDP-N-acetylglucosamine diphosphorylase/glucosamine-1-phosphate N-acetyltransferase GlmU [Bosea sp. (in: a-proteobacteria)]TAJ33311.1 MAG: bifunctional UDP-N-acetylglucosamine diphosphorylase/glucosamine-1-phosphate N-acetyltransferase GlmU [Bosea sp. (in: a-proteobacteria)]
MTEIQPDRSCLAIILAAGEGTRMKSARPKVLHAVAGRSLLGHALAAVSEAGASAVCVVVSPERPEVGAEALSHFPAATLAYQHERRGTAHAVLAAREALQAGYDDVIVAFADTPLVRPETFRALRAELAAGAAVAVLAFVAEDPTGYGRLVFADGQLDAIVEHKDATPEQRRIVLCNAGLMALSGADALPILEAIGDDNAQREFYLPDAVEVARSRGLKATETRAPANEVMGVNDRIQLAAAEAEFQARKRLAVMAEGATLVAPETVFFSFDTQIGRDVVIEPNCVFGPGVSVADGAVIHAFSHLEGAEVGPSASVGPYGRLRPGAKLAEKARVGNFVEIKASEIGAGAKVNHLTYIGDASVGAGANIGAGTITCNYDGFNKARTVIGAGAFVGSNSALVAPVTIGDGAYVGSGSVITQDVGADALAVGRARQVEKAGWASRFRAAAAALKARRAGP